MTHRRLGSGKGSLLNSASLTPKPLASSVYVHVLEAPSPLKPDAPGPARRSPTAPPRNDPDPMQTPSHAWRPPWAAWPSLTEA